MIMKLLRIFAVLFCAQQQLATGKYMIDDTLGLGRRFDGIGGLSGGGATSRLLQSYPDQQRDEILDLLFKPYYAASLHILKVEIGGDGQSTDGTESSHMHSEDDENYQRGYEWWLMKEAKKRNPNIKLYGLPWAFPAWVGGGGQGPYDHPELTAKYITKWVNGAKQTYGLHIDYIGIWNERNFDSNYIKVLRQSLDAAGFETVQIVASDSGFDAIAEAVTKDLNLSAAVDILGAHYPGTVSSDLAKFTNKPLWASEDYSTKNDDVGAGCWARLLNQNYVNGLMTSTISWNLIASYSEDLPYPDCALMSAVEPWSGHYTISGPIYVSAHTTQFTQIGDTYLVHGSGVGMLDMQGSYVSLTDGNGSLTIIIETMSHDHSKCIRPPLPPYDVEDQTATFQLGGNFADIQSLNRWDTQLMFSNNETSQYFIKKEAIEVTNGVFSIDLPPDHLVTLSTRTNQQKGTYTSPPSKPFPVPYEDNFDDYDEFSEANYFADQAGVFEIRKSVLGPSTTGMVMTQVVPTHVISWCNDSPQPITLLSSTFSNLTASISVRIPDNVDPSIDSSPSVFISAMVSTGGCGTPQAKGIFFWLNSTGSWAVSTDLAYTNIIGQYHYNYTSGEAYTLGLKVTAGAVFCSINDYLVYSDYVNKMAPGFVAFGTSGYFMAEFDDFKLQ